MNVKKYILARTETAHTHTHRGKELELAEVAFAHLSLITSGLARHSKAGERKTRMGKRNFALAALFSFFRGQMQFKR